MITAITTNYDCGHAKVIIMTNFRRLPFSYNFLADPPRILSIRAVPSLMSVNISWNSTNNNTGIKILDYRVILVDTTTQQKREFNGINISNLYVTELKHNRTYVVKVQARNEDGYGWFKIKNFTTLEAGQT